MGWGPGCFQLPLLMFFCLYLLPPQEGCLVHGGCPSSAGLWWELAGSSVSGAVGCPRLCSGFGGSGLTRVTCVHGQQGRAVWLLLRLLFRLHGGCGCDGSSRAERSVPIFLNVGLARRSQDKWKEVLAYGIIPASS